MGTQKSTSLPWTVPRKPFRVTPITRKTDPFRFTELPGASRRPPEIRSQRDWLTTISGWASRRPSPGVKRRPRPGRSPRVVK